MGHPIHKHMKGFQSRELTDMPIMHDEKGEGRGGHEGGPSPAKQHGQSKGDQSATHLDYANYKGTDKGYHGHTGASHGDQSATHLDYMGPTQQGKVETKGGGMTEEQKAAHEARKAAARRANAAKAGGYTYDPKTNIATMPGGRKVDASEYDPSANLKDHYPMRRPTDPRSLSFQQKNS